MLLSKEVEVKITGKNIEYYISKGYLDIKRDDIINVKVEDLPEGCNTIEVEYCCDYCLEENILTKNKCGYRDYLRKINATDVKKVACLKCIRRKVVDTQRYNQSKGLLSRNDVGYWSFVENIKKEFFNYINNGNMIDEMRINDHTLYDVLLHRMKMTPYEYSKFIGYNCKSNLRYKTCYYLDNRQEFENDILNLINKFKHFPNRNQIYSELNVSDEIFKEYNGIIGLKKVLNYDDKDELIDNRGDWNHSAYELDVANFFIYQGMKDNYLREQYPFEGYNYRSDFTFYPANKDDKIIHIEVWGYPTKEDNNERRINYNKVRKIKEMLYSKFNDSIILISIEPEIFKKSYEEIFNELNRIFTPYLNLKLQKMKYDLIKPRTYFTELELIEEIMKYSNNKEYVPYKYEIDDSNLLNQIDKYGGLEKLAKNFNKKFKHRDIYLDFTDEEVVNGLLEMYFEYNKILTLSEGFKDKKYKTLYSRINRFIGLVNSKILLYKYLIKNNMTISKEEYNFLERIRDKHRTGNNITQEQRDIARELLKLINESQLAEIG